MTVRAALRQATAPRHAELDGDFAALDVAKREDYATFLAGIASAYLPVEARLDEGGIALLFPDWPLRARGSALRHDLQQLGVTPALLEASPLTTPEAMLGALYVLEGSRLGGEMLLRRVRGSVDPQVRDASRFLGHGQKSGLWQSFLATLEAQPMAGDRIARMTEAADRTFLLFIDAARAALASAS